MDQTTLLVIPCCQTKAEHGNPATSWTDPLASSVSAQCYADILAARFELLRQVKTIPGKSLANAGIREGFDFGQGDNSGRYLEALARYDGHLSSVSGFRDGVRKAAGDADAPRILILSALYGPLHPLSPIQNYDLRMEDKRASAAWKSAFPQFLKEYVSRNNIRSVRLFLGRTTAYLKVARAALLPLIQNGGIEASFYDVENGSSSETPRQHEIQFLADLDPSRSASKKAALKDIP